ncbi:hypothetical protein, partial [Photobacterium lucens]|uniref:hypothetical protein n=1 Tax=Photobacterium lucens TaxID=2562949 RepID=UPI00136EB0BA
MSGVFAIRITSCVLTFKFISEFIGLVKSNNVFENNFKKNIYKLNSEENNIDLLDTKQASFLLQKDLFSMSTLQYAFYLSCVSSLWFSTINAYSTIIISLTSWCLFYIIDDWSIISDYSKEYKKTPMKSHKIKVNFFNVLLFSVTSI